MAFNSSSAFLQEYGGKWRRFSNVSSTVGGKARAPKRGGSVSTMAAAFAGFSGRPGSGRELEGMQFSSGVLCAFHRFDDELSRQGRLRGLDERRSGREDRYRAREMTTFLHARSHNFDDRLEFSNLLSFFFPPKIRAAIVGE